MLRKHLVGLIVGVVLIAVLGAAAVVWLTLNGPQKTGPGPDAAAPAGATASGATQPPSGSPAPSTAAPGTAASASPEAGPRRMSRLLYDDGQNTATVTGLEVTTSGQLRVQLRYETRSPGGWVLSCPERAVDLQSSHLTLADGRRVNPVDTYCAAERSGEDFTLRPGAVLESWGVFPVVPSGGSFSLTWYDLGTVDGLKL
ncbi:hypothetical protein FJK98_25295 [Micromonospora sp. HM134]|uniref:hypothetical protein n=1 Tax=unclassified Micromonospora TaxID=2617518 RepID=UPI0011984C33|nr:MULTISPECIES: hypothetical protein [unclassified Micromonospora]QDY10060.1 hypothetical protein FJK98_25295 [Micromonospora sp. HM134]